MSYYHVYIGFVDKKKKRIRSMNFGYPEEHIRRNIVNPYMKNESFFFGGEVINPSEVDTILIFRSDEWAGKRLILPNGKSAMDEKDVDYTLKCLQEGRVKGTFLCTEDFITSAPKEETIKTVVKQVGERERVFIAHGRDKKQALLLQKYLTKKLKINAEMFEDFKEESGSNTIIEQLEYIKDNVGYAFVVVTPDDLGCLREEIDKCRAKTLIGKESIKVQTASDILDKFQTRARQNVVFEHGLFIGALGRDRVCCLLQKDTKERPSDIDGILYVDFNKSVKEKFSEITEKLRKVGLIT